MDLFGSENAAAAGNGENIRNASWWEIGRSDLPFGWDARSDVYKLAITDGLPSGLGHCWLILGNYARCRYAEGQLGHVEKT